MAHSYLPEHMNKEHRKAYGMNMFIISKKVYQCYNTYELILPSENVFATKFKSQSSSRKWYKEQKKTFVDLPIIKDGDVLF
jgi:hypothetical protein